MPEYLSSAQVEAIRRYWNVFQPQFLSDPIYESVLGEQLEELDRQVVREIAAEQGLSEMDFRENILGESPQGFNRFHSLWGGKVAQRVLERCQSEVHARIESTRGAIHQRLCVEFQYCIKRQAGDFEREGMSIAIGVADALMSIATQIPLPITTVSVYLVKTQLLDKWCDCKQKKQKA